MVSWVGARIYISDKFPADAEALNLNPRMLKTSHSLDLKTEDQDHPQQG